MPACGDSRSGGELERAYDPETCISTAQGRFALAVQEEGDQQGYVAYLRERFRHRPPGDATTRTILMFERFDRVGQLPVAHLVMAEAATGTPAAIDTPAFWCAVQTRVLNGTARVESFVPTQAPPLDPNRLPGSMPAASVPSPAVLRSLRTTAAALFDSLPGESARLSWLELDGDGRGSLWGTMGGEAVDMQSMPASQSALLPFYHVQRAGSLVAAERVEVVITADTFVYDHGRSTAVPDYPFAMAGFVGFLDYVPVRVDLESRGELLLARSITILGPAGESPRAQALRLMYEE